MTEREDDLKVSVLVSPSFDAVSVGGFLATFKGFVILIIGIKMCWFKFRTFK